MYKDLSPGFADLAVENRRLKSVFLKSIDSIIGWRIVSNVLHKHLGRGICSGSKSYRPLIMFKMSLLQTWYGLSD